MRFCLLFFPSSDANDALSFFSPPTDSVLSALRAPVRLLCLVLLTFQRELVRFVYVNKRSPLRVFFEDPFTMYKKCDTVHGASIGWTAPYIFCDRISPSVQCGPQRAMVEPLPSSTNRQSVRSFRKQPIVGILKSTSFPRFHYVREQVIKKQQHVIFQ